MVEVTLLRGRERRPLAGHPWIYQGEIERIEGDPEPGERARVKDFRGRFIGMGYINPRSQITVRLLTWEEEAIDEAFLQRRIRKALEYRKRIVADTDACRLISSEGDFLPGLIVDRYGDLLVLQILTAGMERLKEVVVQLLVQLLSPKGIYERNDSPSRLLEGLEHQKGPLYGDFDRVVQIQEGGVKFWVDVAEGQKTGFFLDQRENRFALRGYAEGKEVLDGFCYSGGFALNALYAGAASAVGIDLSPAALDLAKRSAEANGLADRCTFKEANAFDELRALERTGRHFDLIILDPPAFTRGKEAVAGAIRGYKEINLRAMKLLREGGILLTCSCSYHLDAETFLGVLQSAALDAKKRLRLLELRTQARDHLVLLGVKETYYLKCAILEVMRA
ncbi:MAG: class I SAM-dependent rRNA methyltransferase [candidate division NC10 bacterium]|nr:class I SAM-dependent rRNA methyltransferase [candidate division NC10 bacterium]